MKFTKYVTLDTELEVDLTSDDIETLLTEQIKQLEENPNALTHRNQIFAPLNCVYAVLKGYPDAIIARMPEKDKQMVYPQLLAQLDRFKPMAPGS